MATTINTRLKKVKLIQAKTLSELETAVNTYVSGLGGEYAMSVDIDATTVSVVGTTTTE